MCHMREKKTGWMGRVPGIAALGLIALPAEAIVLPPGGVVPLMGTTAAIRPELAGLVIYDELIDFEIRDGAVLLYRGTLQNRVVRSDLSGNLHFYYYIRDTEPGLNGYIRYVRTTRFPGVLTDVDYRLDGLGTVGPDLARRSPAPGTLVEFEFSGLLPAGQESRFFFIITDVKEFVTGGETTLYLHTGQRVTLPTVMPAPTSTARGDMNC
ncbi:MAG: hypothetical protein AB1716_11570, partial [Planctomycetota bacterium]